MAFVKLDCAILHSSIWPDKQARDIFITSLLMAEPFELSEPAKQINVLTLDETGWEIPPGWYGFVRAAGAGIVHMAGVEKDAGLQALVRLCAPESESRNPANEGRRMARISGGYLILNFFAYRDRDHTAAERMRRLRERNKLRNGDVTGKNGDTKLRNVTQAEDRVQSADADADADADKSNTLPLGFVRFWSEYPTAFNRRQGKPKCLQAWRKKKLEPLAEKIIAKLRFFKASHDWTKEGGQFVPMPLTWMNRETWLDEQLPAPRGSTSITKNKSYKAPGE